MSFFFKGTLPASKSLLNRALVIASYAPGLKVIGDSQADDVQLMRNGLRQLFANQLSGQSQPIDCGHAGTVLRFLALRAARFKGVHHLMGSLRLFSRPQSELLAVLGQLGSHVELRNSELLVRTDDWHLIVDGLQVNAERSSQFASAVILNSWGLSFDLHFTVSKKIVSEGYLQMTIELVRKMGMGIQQSGNEFMIAQNQQVLAKEYLVEPDLSSAFAVAALAVVDGEATIQNFPRPSLQPDAAFLRILEKMGADIRGHDHEIVFRKTAALAPVEVNIESSPDLFPILAVLCALARGPSEISGVGHLKFKESSRLERTAELLALFGAKISGSDTKVIIEPARERNADKTKHVFDVDQDHRMAMAVAVAERAGFPVQSDKMKVVGKSFPEFLQLVEGGS